MFLDGRLQGLVRARVTSLLHATYLSHDRFYHLLATTTAPLDNPYVWVIDCRRGSPTTEPMLRLSPRAY
jgi:hypothetical protein